jgi:hypothetical protein
MEEIGLRAAIAFTFMRAGSVFAAAYCRLIGLKCARCRLPHSLSSCGKRLQSVKLQAGNDNSCRATPAQDGHFDDSLVSCAVCRGVTGIYIPVCIHCGAKQSVFAPANLDVGK